MLRSTDQLPINEELYAAAEEAASDAEHETSNFVWLALYFVIVRVGWVFKTESIIMPAFMDYIGGGPVLRGCLPVLNRFGFSVPPVLYAPRLKSVGRKKWALATTTFAMSLPFAVLSGVWLLGLWQAGDGEARTWLPAFVLIVYGIFFALMGMNQLAAHALQGKLIRATRRGRLMTASIVIGAPLAIFAAWYWMTDWLAAPDGGFGRIFGATALAFATASLTMFAVRESSDRYERSGDPWWYPFLQTARLLARDGHFRRLALVAALFGTTFMLFPHYQALGRERLGLMHGSLLVWLCVQNAAIAVFSILMGPLADRFGNRLALRCTVFGCASTPLLAYALATIGPQAGQQWYWIVFATTALTPVTIRLIANYTLEIAVREHHPQYVSTVGLCLAAPVMVGSPLVGYLIGLFGYEPILLAGAIVLGLAGLLTFRLIEPRHGQTRLRDE